MKLVLASQNAHKLDEFSRMLEPLGIEIVSVNEVCGETQIEENGASFMDNARIKALTVFSACGLPTVADDSGLCVDALEGAPGVSSARYAGDGHNDKANNEKLLAALEQVPDEERGARFVCAICCILAADRVIEVEGSCGGHIARSETGEDGFGYDPLFIVEGGDRSFAQLPGEEKDRVSHRGMALRKLFEALKSNDCGSKKS